MANEWDYWVKVKEKERASVCVWENRNEMDGMVQDAG